MDYIIYTDGGARGNPGPAGAGAYITDGAGHVVKECSKFLGHATNNVAEYEAVLLGLHSLQHLIPKSKHQSARLEFRMDSELIQRQLLGKYKVKEPTLQQLHRKVRTIIESDFPHTQFVHVRREKNTDADRLANLAMDRGE